MMLFGLLLIGLVVYVLLRIPGSKSGRTGPRPEDPLEILRRRFAEGEISEEDFLRMRRGLTEVEGERHDD